MCQFYQRAWKLISKQQQKAHPMQYQASRIDKDGNGYRSESELCRTCGGQYSAGLPMVCRTLPPKQPRF